MLSPDNPMHKNLELSTYTTPSAIFALPCTEIKFKPPFADWNIGFFSSSAPISTNYFTNGYSSFIVLTGQTNHYEIIASPELIKNIGIANQINSFVQSKIPMPANNPLKSGAIRELLAQNEIAQANALIIENFERQFQIRESSDDIQLCINKGVGSCEEMAEAGFLYAHELGLENVERVMIENGDHHFLVIGRNQQGDPCNYFTWGENTTICDPWSGGYYPISYLEGHLKDYIGCQRDETGFLHCMVNPFNPFFHKIKILDDTPEASAEEEIEEEEPFDCVEQTGSNRWKKSDNTDPTIDEYVPNPLLPDDQKIKYSA